MATGKLAIAFTSSVVQQAEPPVDNALDSVETTEPTPLYWDRDALRRFDYYYYSATRSRIAVAGRSDVAGRVAKLKEDFMTAVLEAFKDLGTEEYGEAARQFLAHFRKSCLANSTIRQLARQNKRYLTAVFVGTTESSVRSLVGELLRSTADAKRTTGSSVRNFVSKLLCSQRGIADGERTTGPFLSWTVGNATPACTAANPELS
jgi:hypothetical protein